MTRVVVTGSNGFIGRSLVPSLNILGFEVFDISRIDGDITDISVWNSIPTADVVVHLAGKSYIPDSWTNVSKFIDVNLSGTIKALEYCVEHDAQMIFASTYVYGIPKELPIKESHPVDPNNPYALSKYLCENSCRFYSKYMGVQTTVLRFFNVYGSKQRQDFLIPNIVSQVNTSEYIILNDLNPRRDYLFINDAVNAVIKAILTKLSFDIFNIGSGISHSVNQVVDIVQKEMGTSLEVKKKDNKRKYEINDIVADIYHAKHILDWEPQYNFVDGISEMLKSH
jgi:GDP-4-dehydro-6-deoxy-D-mannose reductase